LELYQIEDDNNDTIPLLVCPRLIVELVLTNFTLADDDNDTPRYCSRDPFPVSRLSKTKTAAATKRQAKAAVVLEID
jgi:hypothetical protein